MQYSNHLISWSLGKSNMGVVEIPAFPCLPYPQPYSMKTPLHPNQPGTIV